MFFGNEFVSNFIFQSLVDEERISTLISELRQNGTYSFNYRYYHPLKEVRYIGSFAVLAALLSVRHVTSSC